jgi:hypothetical protein
MSAVPKIVEARAMTLPEAIRWAMEGQTRLIDAQVKICIWETERIVNQARTNPTWDTCFHRCLWELGLEWAKQHPPVDGRAEHE